MAINLIPRKRGGDPNKINFYIVVTVWDPELKKERKDQQIYIGSRIHGVYRFNKRARQYASFFAGTEFEEGFRLWHNPPSPPKEECFTVEEIQESEDKSAGIDLFFSHIAGSLGLTEKLQAVFGKKKSAELLSLAYYCASEGRSPLYRSSIWSENVVLPCESALSVDRISNILHTTSPSKILTFLTQWASACKPEEMLSLDITSVSSYSKNNEDVMLGYNRDREHLPQINLLMLVSQTSKLPMWFEQLPGAASDVAVLKDTIEILSKAGIGSKKLVLDRGFASQSNISSLLKHRFKFTLGIPLYRFTTYRDMIKEAYEKNEFCNPASRLTIFDDSERAQTQAVTKLIKIDERRVWLHMYYTDFYRTRDNEVFMERLKEVQEKLEKGEKLSTPKDQELAEKCFEVKCTPKRGIKVKPLVDKIAEFRNNDSGFFAIMSNQFKDAGDALEAYKLRDGIEKRFDDLKNEADLKRLRMHSRTSQYARLFIQFLAEILRCHILHLMQEGLELPKKIKTVNDLIWEMKSIRRIRIGNTRSLYLRPTKNQLAIIGALELGLDPNHWSPL